MKKLINDKVIKLVIVSLAFFIMNIIVYSLWDFEITAIYILSFIESMIIVNNK